MKGWGFFTLNKWSTEDLGTFQGFPEDDWDLFNTRELHASLAEEEVFCGGDNVSSEDIGRLGIGEKSLETWEEILQQEKKRSIL